ncbi:MAG: hypothetical protein AAF403_08600, partial [Pseudomonadota bacterium]
MKNTKIIFTLCVLALLQNFKLHDPALAEDPLVNEDLYQLAVYIHSVSNDLKKEQIKIRLTRLKYALDSFAIIEGLSHSRGALTPSWIEDNAEQHQSKNFVNQIGIARQNLDQAIEQTKDWDIEPTKAERQNLNNLLDSVVTALGAIKSNQS